MDRGATAGAWNALPVALRTSLGHHGMDDPVLFISLFAGAEDDVVDNIIEDYGGKGLGDEARLDVREQLLALRDLAGPASKRGSARRASFSTPMAVAEVTRNAREHKRARAEEVILQQAASLPMATVPEPRGEPQSWPTKLRRSLALAGDPAARRKAEDSERHRWAHELAALIEEASLPLAVIAGETQNRESVMLRAAQGRRASTLRRRVRDWRKARRFFQLTLGRPWPTNEAAVLDYVEVCASAPSGKILVRDFMDALAFLERGGDVAEAVAFHKNTLLVTAVRDIKGAGAEMPQGRGQAPRIPLRIVIALEQEVLNTAAPRFVRMFAWSGCSRFGARFDLTIIAVSCHLLWPSGRMVSTGNLCGPRQVDLASPGRCCRCSSHVGLPLSSHPGSGWDGPYGKASTPAETSSWASRMRSSVQ